MGALSGMGETEGFSRRTCASPVRSGNLFRARRPASETPAEFWTFAPAACAAACGLPEFEHLRLCR
jgi:hypothetical protein